MDRSSAKEVRPEVTRLAAKNGSMHLGADESSMAGELLPARMINELSYCPRLFFLEWVQGEFADNAFTVEGRMAHRRVDGSPQALPEDERPFSVRSVALSSERLGVSAKIDLVEGEANSAVPVDYKRGRAPDNPLCSHEPERVQLCVYALLLREHGYICDRGVLYFVQSKSRVEVMIDDALIRRTLELISDGRALVASGYVPPPLVGSSKCQGCSLSGICLPDEVNQLRADAIDKPRHFIPARDDARALYVQDQGARIGLDGEVLLVRDREGARLAEARLLETSQVVVVGNVQVSAQAIRELCSRDIPICWMTYGGWLAGMSQAFGHGNIELRRAQFRLADDEAKSLSLARRLVRTKLANCRTLLRRNAREADGAVRELARLMVSAETAADPAQLLGIEGQGASVYFPALATTLRPPGGGLAFQLTERSRRPPKDPINALLSFGYSLLAKEVTAATRAVGFDPYLGFYHRPRFGRPALALDVMEEFRPIIADSVVLSSVNTGVISGSDFIRTGLGVGLKPDGRKRFLRAFERRLDEEVTHPVFGYRISYRRVIEVQCRLLARFVVGEIPEYPEFRTR